MTFDVAVVGGGPGGSATALALRAHAPSLSVALIEASRYESPRIGETLPPPARQMLEHLGVWEAFRFVGETLLDSPDPDIQRYLQWLDNQHRRDLN